MATAGVDKGSGQVGWERVRVSVGREQMDELLAACHELGVDAETERSRHLDPDTVVMLLAGPPVAVAATVAAVDRLRGGQVIDLRDGQNRTFYRSRDLTYGSVLVLARDGSLRMQSSRKAGSLELLLGSLMSRFSDGEVGSISDVAEFALSGDAGDVAIIAEPSACE